MKKLKILFLSSGGGGTMKFIHLSSMLFSDKFEVVGVIADRECGATDYSHRNDLPTHIITPWKDKNKEIISIIKLINPDIVITNIYKILPEQIFKCCNAIFINLHYSLLPSYGGVIGFKTLEMAKENNAQIIGATCHYVNENVDEGKIISQGAMGVNWSLDLDTIGNFIFRIACKTILEAILSFCGVTKSYEANDGFIYCPKLNFDDQVFDEVFWQNLKSL